MPLILRWLLRLGPANPIAVRLVQNGSRRPRHLYIRATYLAVLIIVLLWLLLIGSGGRNSLGYRELAEAGARAFTYIAYLQVLLICVLAPVFMGGAIAQEASPRTWEVLLTTPMTASEIVLGNLFGRLFFVLALLFCSLPLFALSQYFGGVPSSAVFASYLVSGGAALLVGALAIALSVSRLVGKRAFFVFYVAIVTYLGLTIAIDIALRGNGSGMVNGKGVTLMTGLNPFLALYALLNPTTYPSAPEGSQHGILKWMLETPVKFWCIGSVLLSVAFMFVSTFTVRLGGLQALGADSSGVPWHRRLFGLKPRPAGEHRAPKVVWTNPIAWREAASRNSSPAKVVLRYVFLAVGLGIGGVILVLFHRGDLTLQSFRFTLLSLVWGELAVIALVGINTAATAISKEREDGTLDLLLTTPITAKAYVMGKLRGLVAYLMPLLAVPLVTLGMACLYSVLTGQTVPVAATPQRPALSLPAILPEAALLVPVVVIPFMAFCVMVGLNWSLKSRGTLGSVVATVGVVGAISGVIGLCAWNAVSIAVLGPSLTAVSPVSLLFAAVYPENQLLDSFNAAGTTGARFSLAIGCVVGAAIYVGVCYGILTNMVRTFDMTVRKLAGGR